MNVPVSLMLAQVQRQSYLSSYSSSSSSSKTRVPEKNVDHPHPTFRAAAGMSQAENISQEIPLRYKQMALRQEAASHAAKMRKIREAGL